MTFVSTTLLLLFYFCFPAVIIYVVERNSLLSKIGSVAMAYVVGVVVGNIGLLPANAAEIQDILMTVTVPVALPLLLFSADIRGWFKLAPKTMLSMALALVSVTVMVSLGYLWFNDQIADAWKIGGMLFGVYTGGTPNLAAIGTALDVAPNAYLFTHTADIMLSSLLFLVILFAAKPLLSFILPPFQADTASTDALVARTQFEDYGGLVAPKNRLPLAKALGLALLIFAVGGGLSFVVPQNASTAVAIVTITTLGIAASFVPAIHRLPYSFELGMYLIIVFSLVVASMVRFDQFNDANPAIFGYVALAVFGSLLLHILLSALFRIDTDTTIITATALIFSPPVVPVVAGALKNKLIIISGLSVGIIGYAIGNYLGIFISYILKGFE